MAQTVTEKTRFWRARVLCFNKLMALCRRQYLNWVPDEAILRLQFYLKLGRPLDLKQPLLYNDRLQWIKLHDRDPRYKTFVDKVAVRDYVAQTLGARYLIPEIARYEKWQDVRWDALPERFALKLAHGSGCNILCRDKAALDVEGAMKKLERWSKLDWYWPSREWPYLGVKPRVLVEAFLEGENGDVPRDYKILCFAGVPKYIIVDVDRYSNHTRNFYDVNWVRQDMFNRHPGYEGAVPRPENLSEMLDAAARLSKGVPHVRVDLYNVGGKIYFGEMTFFHGYGMEVFRPRAFEAHLGELTPLEVHS